MAFQPRQGAIVVCDNVELFEREYSDYTSFVRNPGNGFRSVLLSHEGGLRFPSSSIDERRSSAAKSPSGDLPWRRR